MNFFHLKVKIADHILIVLKILRQSWHQKEHHFQEEKRQNQHHLIFLALNQMLPRKPNPVMMGRLENSSLN